MLSSGAMLARALLSLTLLCSCTGADEAVHVTPTSGRKRGGLDVRIEGSGFAGRGPATVHVGNKSAKSVVIESATLIRFKTPPTEEEGMVDVRVQFADGTTIEVPGAFTYERGDEAERITPERLSRP